MPAGVLEEDDLDHESGSQNLLSECTVRAVTLGNIEL